MNQNTKQSQPKQKTHFHRKTNRQNNNKKAEQKKSKVKQKMLNTKMTLKNINA